ncbi:uncharacterized protein B0T23DRAFT_196479 [Neurospora hispaniola]|uniref:Ketoreductase domain-containing protein n=1 Tax=Neurospora hispaniola TaxID=588809 RepID=A0AAJ0I3S4_9PEZI|nr:hypothetical protein B0T23DRAFT_196479 [Neurospora hispaniola]
MNIPRKSPLLCSRYVIRNSAGYPSAPQSGCRGLWWGSQASPFVAVGPRARRHHMKSLTSRAPRVSKENNDNSRNYHQQNKHRSASIASYTRPKTMSEPKVIIVTGGSKGIGLAVVQDLLKASHKVVLVARTPVSELAKDYPGQVTFLAADMTVSDTAHRAVELALISYGKLDGVVVNHGVLTPITRLADASIEDWKSHYDVNVFSALSIVKEAIPHLRATKGKIIFVSSGAAIKAYAAWGAYGSSKAALNSICRHVAVEEPDITAVAVSPGRVDTDMQKELREKGQGVMSDKEYADFVSAFEEGQLNKPEWPAQVIAKLSLDAKSDLSGKYVAWNGPEVAEYRE